MTIMKKTLMAGQRVFISDSNFHTYFVNKVNFTLKYGNFGIDTLDRVSRRVGGAADLLVETLA